jgi:hypothetical protein
MPAPDQEGKTLADYVSAVAQFAESKDLMLRGVWDALDYGPTFVLADASRLRPIGRGVWLLRRENDKRQHFDLVSYEEVAGQVVVEHQVEKIWMLN